MDGYMDFVAGCLGGIAGVLVGHPWDTVKVRLQLQSSSNPMYKNAFDCFGKIIRKEGPLAVYKGVTSPLYSLTPINGIIFAVYGSTIRYTSNPEALSSHFIAGSVAGAAQCAVCAPMELAKTRMQMQSLGEKSDRSNSKYSSAFDCLRKVFRTEGFAGVTRGMASTAVREIPGFGVYFLSYEWLCRSLRSTDTGQGSLFVFFIAGGLAGCISWTATYPADVIKSRLQADEIVPGQSTRYRYNGIVDCVRKSIATDGVRVLVRGLNTTLARAFPTNAATLGVVAQFHHYVRGDVIEREPS